MKKMGLLGGSFDPIHQGHLSMALRMVEDLSLDGVVLMPTFVPPHKIRERMASAEHRLEMCRLVAKDHSALQVSDLELTREGASFTVDTLKTLQEMHPDTQWYLIMGADMFVTLRTWHRFSDIAQMAVLCTLPRDDIDRTMLEDYAKALQADGCQCYVAKEPVETVSSTEIRRRVSEGESLSSLVSPLVEEYIRQHRLYSDEETVIRTQDEQFIEIIQSRLTPYRFRHSMCVAEEARRLALRYGADGDKAYTAGILHDILKDTPSQNQLQMMKDFDILLDNVEAVSPTLWHARCGECFLRNILGVNDEEILTAVRYHTTGRKGMSLLEKILFTADFTSADRDYPDVDVMRRLADESLTAAIRYGVEYTIHDLLNRGRAVHTDTVALYNELVLSDENGGQANEHKK